MEPYTFVPFKGRSVKPGQRVQVYRNLNKDGVVYSVRDWKTGLVLGHTSKASLEYCIFVVSEKGRNKVRQTKRKSVHAWIDGFWREYDEDNDDELMGSMVEYNPYKHDTFVRRFSLIPVYNAGAVTVRFSNIVATV